MVVIALGTVMLDGFGISPAAGHSSGAAAVAEAPATGGVSDPVRFVKAAYGLDNSSPDKPSVNEIYDERKPEYSQRLRDLFAIQAREHGKDEVGRLDFDIYTSSQDGEIKDVKVVGTDVDFAEPPRKIVVATFMNIDRPTKTVFYFEKQGDRWYLDDMEGHASISDEEDIDWTLSTVLKYGWP